MKYVKATYKQVLKMKERVMKQMPGEEASIIEFLLNEQGFTMDKDKADYPKRG